MAFFHHEDKRAGAIDTRKCYAVCEIVLSRVKSPTVERSHRTGSLPSREEGHFQGEQWENDQQHEDRQCHRKCRWLSSDEGGSGQPNQKRECSPTRNNNSFLPTRPEVDPAAQMGRVDHGIQHQIQQQKGHQKQVRQKQVQQHQPKNPLRSVPIVDLQTTLTRQQERVPRYSLASGVLLSCEWGDVGDSFGVSTRAMKCSTGLNPPLMQVTGSEPGKMQVNQTEGDGHGNTKQNIRSFAKVVMQSKLPTQINPKLQPQPQQQPQTQPQPQQKNEQKLRTTEMKNKITPMMKEEKESEGNTSTCSKATGDMKPTMRVSGTKEHVVVPSSIIILVVEQCQK